MTPEELEQMANEWCRGQQRRDPDAFDAFIAGFRACEARQQTQQDKMRQINELLDGETKTL